MTILYQIDIYKNGNIKNELSNTTNTFTNEEDTQNIIDVIWELMLCIEQRRELTITYIKQNLN